MIQELLLYLIIDVFDQSFDDVVPDFVTVNGGVQLDAFFHIPVKLLSWHLLFVLEDYVPLVFNRVVGAARQEG